MISPVIYSTGSYLPEKVVRNEDLTHFPPSSLKHIAEMTGVLSRRHADPAMSTSDLAIEAARNCLDKCNFPADQVDGIVLSTSSPDRIQPATATRVQHELGAGRAFAFDINSVCSGSTFGICLAGSLIKSGTCRNLLLIAAEMYTKILYKRDFTTYPLFGNGAGAILIKAADSSRGVLHSCMGTNGGGRDVICIPGGGTMLPFEQLETPRAAYFQMSGKAVYEFAVEEGSKVIFQLLDETGIQREEVRKFVCHQANINILKAISEKIGAPFDKFYVNLDRYGNTASASVLIGLDELISRGDVSEGDLVVTVAFGGGLSWGANLIRI
jgi:3-oxoacyl-[acyl-carrier-protein] synthase-3